MNTTERDTTSVQGEADETWSEDLTASLLYAEIKKMEADLADIAQRRKDFALKIEACDAATEQKTRHLRSLIAFQAMMRGEFVGINPRDVWSNEGQLGMKIGPLLIGATSPDASTRDLQYFEATLREIYQQATHQVRLINDIIRSREQVASQPTGQFPAVPPQDATQAIPTAEECAYCGKAITLDGDNRWRHLATAATYCAPGEDGSPKAIPYAELPPERREIHDLDQVAADPAVTAPDGQERTDG